MNFDDIYGIAHHFTDGVYIKETRIPAGHQLAKHKHNYSHLSVLVSGKVAVSADGVETEYTAPTVIDMRAGVMHEVRSIEDSVWLCVHATDEKDPSKVDEVLILKGV